MTLKKLHVWSLLSWFYVEANAACSHHSAESTQRHLTRPLFLPFQITKQYELLNYSEHGTVVNNVLYSLDVTEKTYGEQADPPQDITDIKDMVRDSLKQVECMASNDNNNNNKVCFLFNKLRA